MTTSFYRSVFFLFAIQFAMVAADDISEELEFFESRIRPVLVEHCYECHAADAKGGLRLDTRDAVLKGGDSGAAVIPNDVESSLLISAIKYENEDLEMPPKGKLPDNVIHDFAKWIETGACDPRDQPQATHENSDQPKKTIDLKAARQEWAFQTPLRQPLPKVNSPDWPKNRIDYFILSRLEENELIPTAEADRRTLARRLSYDLTGLPPTADAIDRFEIDSHSGAYANFVDRLLGSAQFGERWARMWLDVARYAEDQAHIVGDDQSLFYPNAYYYRDWLIRSLNADMPYDEFVSLQIAGDLLKPEQSEELIALGFIGLGPKYYDRGRLDVQADEWEDRVDTVSRGLLGVTVACARCHDHKFDPISTEDYYGMAGIFASTEMFNRPFDEKAPKSDKGQAKNSKDSIHIVRDGEATDLNVFVRGNVEQKGPVVKRGFPRILCTDESVEINQGSGRLELAKAIVDSKNPLTARVIVNRIFGQLTGRPIVGTPSNFGKNGKAPTHPELLDDLSVRFMKNGWSLKWLMREIVQSATYRQASTARQESTNNDPSNRWFCRMNRRRLSVEQWRDTLLALSRQLDGRVGGPSIDIQNPTERRRTVYSSVSRFQLEPMLVLFDFPDANVHAASRSETTTPLQKLFVMNNSFVTIQSRMLADSIESSVAVGDRIILLYRRVFGRLPSAEELRLGYAFVGGSRIDSTETWQHYAHALIVSNELMFID